MPWWKQGSLEGEGLYKMFLIIITFLGHIVLTHNKWCAVCETAAENKIYFPPSREYGLKFSFFLSTFLSFIFCFLSFFEHLILFILWNLIWQQSGRLHINGYMTVLTRPLLCIPWIGAQEHWSGLHLPLLENKCLGALDWQWKWMYNWKLTQHRICWGTVTKPKTK